MEVEQYKYQFINVNIPPRMSKTTLAINFVARGLGMNPKAEYFYITASDELRKLFSIDIRDIVNSELFYLLYGVKLKRDQQARNLWRTEAGGGLKTATIKGQITGFGAGQMVKEIGPDGKRKFEGALIFDDIDKIMDVEKQTMNAEDTHNIVFNTCFSRFNSEDTPLWNIQQRAGEEDTTEALIEHYKNVDQDKICNVVLPVLIDGKPLWPNKMSMTKIEEIKTSPRTAHVFETQYMQNPTSPNDKPFHKSKLKYFKKSELYRILKNSEASLGYIDVKDEGTDYYCHVHGHIIGNTVYITDVIHNQLTTEVTVPKSIELINKDLPAYTCVETNNMGSMVFKDIREHTEMTILGIYNQANKETRIVIQENVIVNNFRFLEDPDMNSEYASYMGKLTKYEYQKNKIDDAPDATAGLGQLLQTRFRHLFTREKAEDKEKD